MKRSVGSLLLVNLIILALLVFFAPHLMVSPGHLIQGHRTLEKDCFACHSPMSGALSTKCVFCHRVDVIGLATTKGEKITSKKIKVKFHQRLTEKKCTSCHSDHSGVAKFRIGGRFSHNLIEKPKGDQCQECHQKLGDTLHGLTSDQCAPCHNQEKWKPARFKHSTLSPANLENCETCHKTKTPNNPVHQQSSGKCGLCHGQEKWKPAQFKHDLLAAANREACGSCHKSKIPTDSLHQNTSDMCGQCHTVTQWKPASFDHKRYFDFDKDHNVKCVLCHPGNNFKNTTCYECHEHSPQKIRSEHLEEGIHDYERCVLCHRNASEDDAERLWKSGRWRDNLKQ